MIEHWIQLNERTGMHQNKTYHELNEQTWTLSLNQPTEGYNINKLHIVRHVITNEEKRASICNLFVD